MNRVDPTPSQKKRLLKVNANRCCVCKRSCLGFNFHHIDGNSSNTIDQNLAVLCTEDHDRNHRPIEYESQTNHLELNAFEILRLKNSWEAFVAEARKPAPKVVATLSCYGTEELIHSMQLVMQWSDEQIEYKRSFHLLDGDLDRLMDEVLKEVASIGPGMKLVVLDQPMPVEHCPCCGVGLSRTMKSAVVVRLTDPTWETDSSCCIFINPKKASLALVFFLREQQLLSASLHLCQDDYLHYSSEGVDDRLPVKPNLSVRTQVNQIIKHILEEWAPARRVIRTKTRDKPRIVSELPLPEIWEMRKR